MTTPSNAPPIPGLACSFCGKQQPEIRNLVRSGYKNSTLCICDECVMLSLQIWRETDCDWLEAELAAQGLTRRANSN